MIRNGGKNIVDEEKKYYNFFNLLFSVEVLWPSNQSLKVCTLRSGFELGSNSRRRNFYTKRSGFQFPEKTNYVEKLEKIFTRNLQHGAMNTVRNRSHWMIQSDVNPRERKIYPFAFRLYKIMGFQIIKGRNKSPIA